MQVMLVMSVMKEHYNGITRKARRLIKKKCILAANLRDLKKKNKSRPQLSEKECHFFFTNDVVQKN